MLFSRNALGLEIYQNGARMVTISGKPHVPKLEAYFDISFPPGTLKTSFKDKNITNPDSFVSKIREAYLKLLVRTSRISVSLPDTVGRVTLLDLETRFKTKDEGTDIIRWKLKKNLPYDINEMHLDYQVLQEKETGEISVLASLISRQVVNQYEDLLEEAGLQPNRIDFTTFNLYRFFASRLESIENAAVIGWHSGLLSILIFYNGVPDFYRVKEIPSGTASAIRFYQEINNSLMFYREKNPGYSVNEVFYIVPPDDNEMLREVIAEAAGLAPVLLDASRIISRNDGYSVNTKELHTLSASIGAAVRNL
jgi:type IV pilus assembly protein PilM